MNLFSVAQCGLYSAQTALNVIANNLNNIATPDYCKQKVILAEACGINTKQGFLGSGVRVAMIQRVNDGFLNAIKRDSYHEKGEIDARHKYSSQIDNLYATSHQDISDAFSQVFFSLQKTNGDSASVVLRQEVLASFSSLLNHFQHYDDTLTALNSSISTDIMQSIADINKYSQQLAKLNTEIAQHYNKAEVLPANLLDRRDALLNQLSSEVAIRVYDTPSHGQNRITLKNGLTLVNEGQSYQLESASGKSATQPGVVYYKDAGGQSLGIDNSHLLQGKLGGLLHFAHLELKEISDSLNELALKTADQFNQANNKGMDLNGLPGNNLFTQPSLQVDAYPDNRSAARPEVSYHQISDVKHEDYEIIAPGANNEQWIVTKGQGQARVKLTSLANHLFCFDGIKMTVPDTALSGERYRISPVSGAIANIRLNITGVKQLALAKLASETDNQETRTPQESDNRNLKNFLAIRECDLTEHGSFFKNYTRMLSQTGNTTSSLKEQKKAISDICNNIEMTEKEYSGVDTSSEYIQMMMMTKYYQANAQILQTATTLFDAILNIH